MAITWPSLPLSLFFSIFVANQLTELADQSGVISCAMVSLFAKPFPEHSGPAYQLLGIECEELCLQPIRERERETWVLSMQCINAYKLFIKSRNYIMESIF